LIVSLKNKKKPEVRAFRIEKQEVTEILINETAPWPVSCAAPSCWNYMKLYAMEN